MFMVPPHIARHINRGAAASHIERYGLEARHPIEREVVEVVRDWRQRAGGLRTGPKTEAQQRAFWADVVTNPYSDHRYYAICERHRNEMMAFGGLTYLGRRTGEGEVSLLVAPELRGLGVGTLAVRLLLNQARLLGLSRVVGECYLDGGPVGFWERRVQEHGGAAVCFGGSMFFSIAVTEREV